MSADEERAFKQPILDKYETEGSPSDRAPVGRRRDRPRRHAYRAVAGAAASLNAPIPEMRRQPDVAAAPRGAHAFVAIALTAFTASSTSSGVLMRLAESRGKLGK